MNYNLKINFFIPMSAFERNKNGIDFKMKITKDSARKSLVIFLYLAS